MRRLIAPLIAALLLLTPALAPSAEAAPLAPEWKLTVTPNADYFVSGSGQWVGVYKVEAENVGTAATTSAQPIVLEATPPPSLTLAGTQFFDSEIHKGAEGDLNQYPNGACPTTLECRWPEGSTGAGAPSLNVGERLIMLQSFTVPPGLEAPLAYSARVSGGGAAAAAQASARNLASPQPPFGTFAFQAALADSSEAPYLEAGGRPDQFSTELTFETYSSAEADEYASSRVGAPSIGTSPVGDPFHAVADLPPGLLVNPQAVPRCALADYFSQTCDRNRDAVGWACLRIGAFTEGGCAETVSPIFNLEPQGSTPGELGIPLFNVPFVVITSGVRSGSDYGIRALNVAPAVGLSRAAIHLWGVPAESGHDNLRGKECDEILASPERRFLSSAQMRQICEVEPGRQSDGGPAGYSPPTPFVTMPTECSGEPLRFRGRYDTWQDPGVYARAEDQLAAVERCGQLSFAPRIEARPTTDHADSPSGLEFDLRVPQDENYNEPATPELHEAVVKLAPGLVVNPSSANGLGGCSPEQIGLETAVGVTPAHFYETPAQCPAASEIGTVEVHTALLHRPFDGAVYLASPDQNPFGSLLAAYIVLEGEGLIFKLPGRIETDPETGQITGDFLENPQLPFEDFHLSFFGGARGDLRTPAACGEYETTAELTPYSHTEATEGGGTIEATPIAHKSSSFETTAGAHEGEECPSEASQQSNAPTFHAGTESPQAGKFTPFSFRLAREDGSQEISKIETTLPPGLTGKLAGVAECSDAQLALATSREHEGGGAEELASSSCPASSELGTVEVGAGAGPTPLYVTGRAYLAGPYKGAPLSLAIVTPAVAGPFDLGDVLVRTALYVNPETAQIKAVSDQIPHILDGIPLDLRSVTLKMDRPNFTLNPTNCNEMGFSGSETSVLENTASLSQRFQVGGCSVLPFNPKLSISLKGSTKRTGHPALKAVLTMKRGEANIAKAQVTLPHSEFLDQGHIGTVCTRVQFQEGSVPGERCPAGSVYGFARAVTPLLDHPVEGPVYLRSSSHKLPDLVAALNGQISVALDGKVDTGRSGGIRNTFEVVPDAPVSRFTLQMKGGAKGLLVNSESLCGKKQHRAEADFTGQNGKVSDTEPTIKVSGCKKHKHRRR